MMDVTEVWVVAGSGSASRCNGDKTMRPNGPGARGRAPMSPGMACGTLGHTH
jgi:hypothetical protein